MEELSHSIQPDEPEGGDVGSSTGRVNRRARLRAGKLRWLLSAAAAAAATGVMLLLFRLPMAKQVPDAKRVANGPSITLSPGRPDELAMRDLAPLFLPTQYNARSGELRLLEPGRSFFDRDAERWHFSEASPDLGIAATVSLPESPVAALAEAPGPLALGIGQTDGGITPSTASGGRVDVFAGNARDSLLSVSLPPGARPASTGRDSLGWRPLEFAASVDASGLIGPLLLTTGSGIEEVDNYFRNYLARTFRVGDRLPPGFYRIVVGP